MLITLCIVSLTGISAATLTTDKPTYTTTDRIKVNFKEMNNHHKDWIAIYLADSTTEWKNVLKWAWTGNKSEGTLSFKSLPEGNYEVRAFYNNSYDAETVKAFTVKGKKAKIVQNDAVQNNELPNDDLIEDISNFSLFTSDDGTKLHIKDGDCEEIYSNTPGHKPQLLSAPCN